MRKYLASFAVFTLICACAVVIARAGAAPQDSKVKAITALDAAWSKAAEARNLDAVVSFYADDAAVYPPNESKATGKKGAREVWGRYFAEPSFNISWKVASAGADGSVGWTSGTYQDSFKGPDGKLVKQTGKYLCVWHQRADGKWEAVQDMWNSDSK